MFSSDVRSGSLMIVASFGITLNVVEMACYVIFFHYVTYHNNNVASAILQQGSILRNSISAANFSDKISSTYFR
jgi:hypothetical protein